MCLVHICIVENSAILRHMDLKFSSAALDRLEIEDGDERKFPRAVVRAYRKRLAIFRAVVGAGDLGAMRSLGMQPSGVQCRVALDEGFVLEFDIVDHGTAVMIIAIVSVETEISI